MFSTSAIPAKDNATPRYRRNVGEVFSTRAHGSLLIQIYDNGELDIAAGVDTFESLDCIFSLPRYQAG